ncbi:MAG: sigma-70 family RNA polymerase sigma factor [Proteobacteria bacterium]|nr:sigma-70 family RNA polymerase sigma factor [Pseudomonadota bacterium]
MSQYQRPVFNLMYRMLGNREEAEDLSQEVFITVFKKVDTFRGEALLSTWIFRIATNICKNRQKYLGRRYYDRPGNRAGLENVAAGQRNVGTCASVSRPDETVEGYQAERLLQQAIGNLGEDQKLVLILRDIENMSYDNIAAITGLPLGTVKSRLHRARMLLKEKLAEHLR